MCEYDHKKIELKWQKKWEKNGIYKAMSPRSRAKLAPGRPGQKKFYGLVEFPYPSGDGLHVGHPRPYIGMDIVSRKKRMEGNNVLFPIGWDAFGLPTENYAIKTGKQPKFITKKNTDTFRRQIKMLGISFDWSREINTTDPAYYKWTQWIFLQFFKKGLAYKAKSEINWCPKDKIGLANEEVVDGKCERCGTPTEKKEKEQWMLGITKYADRLDKDLELVNYPERVKLSQKNWIGRSEGSEIEFEISLPSTPSQGRGKEISKIIILHGRNGTSSNYFYPWLKKELEKAGYEVSLPDLPNTNEPNDEEQANFVIKNIPLDDRTMFVTHSFGGVVAMRILERGIKIGGLIQFSTPISGKFLDNKIRKSVTEAVSKGFDFEKIKRQADFFKVIFDSGDTIVPNNDGKILAKELGVNLEYIRAKEMHFCDKEEPEMLNVILKNLAYLQSLPKKVVYGYQTADPRAWKMIQAQVLEMRNNPTPAEKKLWQSLRKNIIGFHFRRQHVIDKFIVDFVCLSKNLVIEVDGDMHDYQKEKDKERTEILENLGFRIVRFRNNEVLKNITEVIGKIENELKALPLGEGLGEAIKVFTTRADTLFGATYIVLAPEHKLVESLKLKVENKEEIEEYLKKVKSKTDLERTESKEKTGVELKGIKAINPANNEEIPVWIADYVLPYYGTGAVMAVPAHDERDYEFAKKYKLSLRRVVEPLFIREDNGDNAVRKELPFIKRNAICAIIRNPRNDKYLCISWKNYHMNGLVTGGVEEGENIVEASLREIKEETGYKNVKLTKNPEFSLHSKFFHRVKKENRWARFQYLFFELIDEERDPIDEKELAIHDVVWKSKEEIKTFFTVIEGKFVYNLIDNPDYIFTEDGILHFSSKFDDLNSEDARKKITEAVGGKMVTKFKLRDWVFSRQRYWGEPIPIVNCEKCGLVSVKEKDLPVKLPEVKSYKPTNTGESPLAGISKWVNTKCPKCSGKAKRETDTMPNWAGSSWYYLRYSDPKNKKEFASKKSLKYWTPVDWYNGGMEHTTLHLLYSRFWHKFLYDLKLVPTVEPYLKRTSHGMILGAGGVKMSKSLGNVINPDDIVKIYGADTLRVYEMFLGPFEEAVVWNTESIIGSRRFIEKIWRISENLKDFSGPRVARTKILEKNRLNQTIQNFSNSQTVKKLLHKTIKKVGEDIEAMHFNTAISAMMILATEMEKADSVEKEDYKKFLRILASFIPHVVEEIWHSLGEKRSVHFSEWPKYDERLVEDTEIKIVIQVNGKVRDEIIIKADENEEEIKKRALSGEKISKFISGREFRKIVYVKNKIINIVI
jgi:leucyl-tRNA synthetase